MSWRAGKKFLLAIFSLLVMLALLAAQCGGGAPEASGGAAAPAEKPAEEKEAAEEPTEAPAEEKVAEEPTEAPAEEEAAEEPTEAPAEEEAAEEPAEAPAEEEVVATGDFSGLKVALLTSGPINDDGWNQTAYEGLLAVEEAGAEIANTENVAQADQLDLIRSYADQGFNVIIGHGFEYGDAMVQAAEEYPEVSFLQIGGIAENGTNLASYVFRPGEGGYAAGIVAGMMVESGKLGGVGAVEIPTIAADFNAFKNAAMVVNPNVSDVPVAYTGSWVDIPKAKEAAIAQIDSGIELIMANGDNANVGAIEAAAENGATYIIGWTRDQSHLGPEVVLTSNEQRVDHILIDAINAIQDGSIEWTNHVVGFAEGAQSLSKFHPDVPEEVAQETEAVIQAIIDGKIVLDENGNVVTDEYHK